MKFFFLQVIRYSQFWIYTLFMHCSDDHKHISGSTPWFLERYAGAPIAGTFGEVDSSATRHRADHLSACSLSTGAPITS